LKAIWAYDYVDVLLIKGLAPLYPYEKISNSDAQNDEIYSVRINRWRHYENKFYQARGAATTLIIGASLGTVIGVLDRMRINY
jgi:hypothetical protein